MIFYKVYNDLFGVYSESQEQSNLFDLAEAHSIFHKSNESREDSKIIIVK